MNSITEKIKSLYTEHKTYIHIALGGLVIFLAWKMFKK